MAELVFIALCIAGAFVLAMRQAPLWAWAAALAAAVLAWHTGLVYGDLARAGVQSARRSSPGCP